jgi:putative transposase
LAVDDRANALAWPWTIGRIRSLGRGRSGEIARLAVDDRANALAWSVEDQANALAWSVEDRANALAWSVSDRTNSLARRARVGSQGLQSLDGFVVFLFRPEGGRDGGRFMPSAYTQNFYHTVFSTKQRARLITPELESRLYPFIGGIVRQLRCTLLALNGTADHVHLLVRYRADLPHSDLLRHVKARSSKWINETFPDLSHFAWQEGYGGFTVSKSAVADVEAYIARQKEHHVRQDFKAEFLALLRKHGIEFDEKEVFK